MSITKNIRWISQNAQNMIWNEEIIRLKIWVALINEKMMVSCLKWFGHVQRKAINASVRNSELIQVEEKKKCRGKQNITLIYSSKKYYWSKSYYRKISLKI